MDSWQEKVTHRLKTFIDASPPLSPMKDEVCMTLNSREAYVLLNIVEQWEKLSHPLLEVKEESVV